MTFKFKNIHPPAVAITCEEVTKLEFWSNFDPGFRAECVNAPKNLKTGVGDVGAMSKEQGKLYLMQEAAGTARRPPGESGAVSVQALVEAAIAACRAVRTYEKLLKRATEVGVEGSAPSLETRARIHAVITPGHS